MMDIYRKEGSTSAKVLVRSILGFWDSEKVAGIPNENFPLVINATVGKFNVS